MRALNCSGVVLLTMTASSALAHDADGTPSHAFGWTWDPWITAPLALSAMLFAIGGRRLYARAGLGRASLLRQATLFACGWLVLAGSLVSPLHQAGEHSFAAHMVEHELLMLVAAPLLVLSRPLAVMLWALPLDLRRVIGGIGSSRIVSMAWHTLTSPITATMIQAAALWIWHAPALFDLALASDGWHAAQHLSFILTALVFWSAMLGRSGARGSTAARGVAALCLFVTSVVSGALGALMAFSESPWYAGYARLGMAPLGLTPAEDQQVAGLIMWVPGGLVHALAALFLVRTMLAQPRRVVDAV
jgi:putative membrane protein